MKKIIFTVLILLRLPCLLIAMEKSIAIFDLFNLLDHLIKDNIVLKALDLVITHDIKFDEETKEKISYLLDQLNTLNIKDVKRYLAIIGKKVNTAIGEFQFIEILNQELHIAKSLSIMITQKSTPDWVHLHIF